MKVERETLVANTDTEFNFDVKGSMYSVKNFTAGYILVKYGDDDNVGVKIPSNCQQVVTANLINGYSECTNKLIINSDAGGEVEVQCIEY